MKITLLVVGKTTDSYINEGISVYENRLKHYINFQMIVIQELKNTKNITEVQQKEKEGESILKNIQNNDYVALLDDKGSHFTSIQFSDFLSKSMINSIGNMVFVVGGPYGFSDNIYKRANTKVSLSKMTFSHQMIRLFFVEQVYRAMTILKNEPYHHE
jgi:23S rRNA (pseudouridine1915-N3)-methyltransferase